MDRPIRVLEIISGFAVEGPLGGIERFGIELGQALDPERVTPIICGMWAYHTPYEYEWVEQLQAKGVAAFVAADWDEDAPYRSFWRAYRGARQKFSGPVDIIHSHCQFGDGLALLLQRRLQARALVRTVHNEREWGKRPLRRLFLTNLVYPLLYDQEIGVAQRVVDNLNARPIVRFTAQPALRLYNSLNLARFDAVAVDVAAKKATLGIPVDASVVGTVGRLTEQKGYRFLLQAISLILREREDIYFLIIGEGDLGANLEAQAKRLKIEDHVIFTGPRPDVEELLGVMDLFVNSSLWEGLPTVILESMAARVPVVATRVSGNVELIEHEKTGLLVPPAEAAALSAAILQGLSLPQAQRERMTEQAYQFVKATFSIKQVARQHEHLYASLLAD
jgi:glycosyltransferase involved in cell wall biosynthesis